MKNLLAGLLVAGSLALSSMPASAEVDEATARSVMQDAGLTDAIKQLPAALGQGIQSGMAGAGGMVPPEVAQRILKAATESFTNERMLAAALNVVRSGLDAATVTEMRKWNATPLGQKLMAIDKAAAANPDQAKRMAEGQTALQQADEARRKVLTDIIDATKVVDTISEIQLGTAVAMMSGIAAANPAAPGLPSEDQLRSMMQGQLAGMKQQIQGPLTAALAGTYATVATPELQQYLDYLRSPAGSKVSALTLAALGAALKDGGKELGVKIAALSKPAGTN